MSQGTDQIQEGRAAHQGYEEVSHTADWGLRVLGRDMTQLLINAARGMTHLLHPRSFPSKPCIKRQLSLEADDPEGLLVEWLGELAYWAEAEMLLFQEFEVTLFDPLHLKATVHGQHVTNLEKAIKAVTYHELKIETTTRGLEVTVIFDV